MDSCSYRVIITAEEEDVLKRVALLNSTMFRFLKETKLKSVVEADYRVGKLVLEVVGTPNNPAFVSGKVQIDVVRVNNPNP